jgi:hypothetical protein
MLLRFHFSLIFNLQFDLLRLLSISHYEEKRIQKGDADKGSALFFVKTNPNPFNY